MKFEYWKSKGQWYWHLRAGNGEIIASGEGYRRKADLLHTISLIRTYANEARPVQLPEKV